MAGRGIYWTDGTPYLISYWCPTYYGQCKVCKHNNNTVRHPYKIINLDSKLSFVRNYEEHYECTFQFIKVKMCLSCFEKHKFIRPTEEELQHHIFKLRKKQAKKQLNNYLINDLTNIILSLDTIYLDNEDDK